MEFITSKNNTLIRARESRKGIVRVDESNNHVFSGFPFMCVKARNKWVWKPLHKISGPVWVENRELVKNSIIKVNKNIKKDHRKWEKMLIKSDEISQEKNQEIKFLFNNVPEYIKTQYFNKFNNPDVNYMHCKVCNEICDLTKITCISNDCGGMCKNCHDSWKSGNNMRKGMFIFGQSSPDKHTCPSCNACQLLECPICYEKKPTEEMIKSDNCTHSICCNCFSKSFKSNPIIECPMCRAQFNRTIVKNKPDDFIDDLSPEEINQVLEV